MKMKIVNISEWIRRSLFLVIAGSMVACAGETAETATEDGEVATTEEAMDDPVVVKEVTAVDLDNDGLYSTFVTTTYYEDYDVNGDKVLDENEFYNSMYKTWDANADNNLDENEWNTGTRDFGMENQVWADWDTNNDGMLSDTENRAGIVKSNRFSDWDTNKDNQLSEREYVDGVFVLWDKNKDGKLDSLEYVDIYNRNFNK